MSEADRARWDARYAADAGDADAVASELRGVPWLDEQVAPLLLARGGTRADSDVEGDMTVAHALDVAAGRGRVALWAAARGLAVTALDVSPVGLETARRRAAATGLPLTTRVHDLDAPLPALPPLALVSCFHYWQPSLGAALGAALAPGGLLVAEIATVRNLERHARPSRRFLVETGELSAWALAAGDTMRVVHAREAWVDDRHLARVVVERRP